MLVTACESDCNPVLLHGVDDAMMSAPGVVPGLTVQRIRPSSGIPPCIYSVWLDLWKYFLS